MPTPPPGVGPTAAQRRRARAENARRKREEAARKRKAAREQRAKSLITKGERVSTSLTRARAAPLVPKRTEIDRTAPLRIRTPITEAGPIRGGPRPTGQEGYASRPDLRERGLLERAIQGAKGLRDEDALTGWTPEQLEEVRAHYEQYGSSPQAAWDRYMSGQTLAGYSAGSLPGQALAEIAAGLYGIVPGLYYLATDPVGTGKGIAKSYQESFQHPLRHPGETALNAWGAATAAVGGVGILGSVARRAGARGAVVDAAANLRPRGGLREVTTGGVRPELRLPLSRAVAKGVRPAAAAVVGRVPFGGISPKGAAVSYTRQIVSDVRSAPAAGLLERYGGRRKQYAESEAARAIASQTTLAERIAAYQEELSTAKKYREKRRLRQRIQAAQDAAAAGLLREVDVGDPGYMQAAKDVGDRFTEERVAGNFPIIAPTKTLAEAYRAISASSVRLEEGLTRTGQLDPDIAISRIHRTGQAFRREDVAPPSRQMAVPARDETAIMAAQARVEALRAREGAEPPPGVAPEPPPTLPELPVDRPRRNAKVISQLRDIADEDLERALDEFTDIDRADFEDAEDFRYELDTAWEEVQGAADEMVTRMQEDVAEFQADTAALQQARAADRAALERETAELGRLQGATETVPTVLPQAGHVVRSPDYQPGLTENYLASAERQLERAQVRAAAAEARWQRGGRPTRAEAPGYVRRARDQVQQWQEVVTEARAAQPVIRPSRPGLHFLPGNIEKATGTSPPRVGGRAMGLPKGFVGRQRYKGTADIRALTDPNVFHVQAMRELRFGRNWQERMESWKQATSPENSISPQELYVRVDPEDARLYHDLAVQTNGARGIRLPDNAVDLLERVESGEVRTLAENEIRRNWMTARMKPGTNLPESREMFETMFNKDSRIRGTDELRELAADAELAGQLRIFNDKNIRTRKFKGDKGAGLSLFDSIIQIGRGLTLFSKGTGHILPQLGGQVGMMATQAPIKHLMDTLTLGANTKLRRLAKNPERMQTLRGMEGAGISESFFGREQGFFNTIDKATSATQRFYSRFIDDWFRDRLALVELDRLGYKSIEQIEKFLDEAPKTVDLSKPLSQWTKAERDVVEVGQRVDDAGGAFRMMTETERAKVSRFIWFWPWFRTSARYTMRLPATHPVVASGLMELGEYGSDETFRRFEEHYPGLGEAMKTYLPGVFPVGEDDEGRLSVVNPMASAIHTSPADLMGLLVGEFELGKLGEGSTLGEWATPPVQLGGALFGYDLFRRRPMDGNMFQSMGEWALGLVPYNKLRERIMDEPSESAWFDYTVGEALAQVGLGSPSPKGLNAENIVEYAQKAEREATGITKEDLDRAEFRRYVEAQPFNEKAKTAYGKMLDIKDELTKQLEDVETEKERAEIIAAMYVKVYPKSREGIEKQLDGASTTRDYESISDELRGYLYETELGKLSGMRNEDLDYYERVIRGIGL